MRAVAKGRLKQLFTDVPAGEPLTSRRLAALGISADLAVAYVRSGWLIRLARGVYSRVGDTPELGLSLLVLRDALPGLHIGGRTALQWHGLLPAEPTPAPLTLYGWDNAPLPEWFTSVARTRLPLLRQAAGEIKIEQAAYLLFARTFAGDRALRCAVKIELEAGAGLPPGQRLICAQTPLVARQVAGLAGDPQAPIGDVGLG